MRPMRDPAPSRLAYKLNRLFLRRRVRLFLRYGLPVLILAALGALWASDPARVEGARDRIAEVKRQIEERPEFMVRMMAVDEASPRVAKDIRDVLSLDFPVSSFDLDLEVLRKTVEELDAVAGADVRVRTGGVLEVTVTERVPVAVWRYDGQLKLIDAEGHRVVVVEDRTSRPELPLLVGQGADAAVAEALDLYDVIHPIRDRLRGFVRVGERRWDIVLDRDQRIQLPEVDAHQALMRVITLDGAQDLLARDITAIDFRNPHRAVIRMSGASAERLYDIEFNEEASQ